MTERQRTGADIVKFVDTINTSPQRTNAPLSDDGGVRYSLLASVDGQGLRRATPGQGIEKGTYRIGTEVRYLSPDTTLAVTAYTDRAAVLDRRDIGHADYLTLLRVNDVLVGEVNVNHVVARSVTIGDTETPETDERYFVVSRRDNHHTVYRDLSGGNLSEPYLLRDVVGRKDDVRRLTPLDVTAAYHKIVDVYQQTTEKMLAGYRADTAKKLQGFRK